MLLRILLNAAYMAGALLLQAKYNFSRRFRGGTGRGDLHAVHRLSAFQRLQQPRIGAESAFARLKNNKTMPLTFALTFLIHVLIVQVAYKAFGIAPLTPGVWVKTVLAASTVVAISEGI